MTDLLEIRWSNLKFFRLPSMSKQHHMTPIKPFAAMAKWRSKSDTTIITLQIEFLTTQTEKLSHSTLISPINVKSRLRILKNSTLYKKFSPSRLIDFLSRFIPFSTPCLLHLCTSLFRKSPCLLQHKRLLILQLLNPLHVYSNLHGN